MNKEKIELKRPSNIMPTIVQPTEVQVPEKINFAPKL
jgi:hypothetical protein